MRSFMDKDFLLQTETAKSLYHRYAEPLPIVDYHSHLSAREIAEDRQYNNLTEAWLDTDPYKWRLMRTAGIEERYITGKDTDPYERFLKFAEILPKAAGNPVFHWSHMELRKFFGFQGLLSAETAKKVWDMCNEKLSGPGFSTRGLLTQAGVEVLCTTNDPTEDLKWHQKLSEDVDFSMQVVPTMRLDYLLRIEHPQWCNYIQHELAPAAGMEDIATMHEVREALKKRINYFEKLGCRAADIVLDRMYYAEAEEYELDDIVGRTLGERGNPDSHQAEKFKTAVLLFLAKECTKRGWAMQIRFSALRSVNSTLAEKLGMEAGCDGMGDYNCAAVLADFLNDLDRRGTLPRMIIYSLNPGDQPVIGSILGAFQESVENQEGGGIRGRLQQGTACWFNDAKRGLERQLITVSSLSLLGEDIGMLADARTPFSLSRHEYYRRILCNFIGNMVENGEYLADSGRLGLMVRDICYGNALRYFGFRV